MTMCNAFVLHCKCGGKHNSIKFCLRWFVLLLLRKISEASSVFPYGALLKQ